MRLVTPNNRLRGAYEKKASNALDIVQSAIHKEWQIIAAYYAIYNSLYGLLMGIGIKSEIHSCTITVAKTYLTTIFTPSDIELLECAYRARINVQYYIDESVSDTMAQKIFARCGAFVVKCKHAVLLQSDISTIRTALQKYI